MVDDFVVVVDPRMVVTAIDEHLLARVRIGDRIDVTNVFRPHVAHFVLRLRRIGGGRHLLVVDFILQTQPVRRPLRGDPIDDRREVRIHLDFLHYGSQPRLRIRLQFRRTAERHRHQQFHDGCKANARTVFRRQHRQ